MKIYKHGNCDRYKETRLTCPKCSCDFSYTIADLYSGVTYDSARERLLSYRYIICPECEDIILVSTEEE